MSVAIGKVHFMIHPAAWSAAPGGPSEQYLRDTHSFASDWYTALCWERAVVGLQHERIDRLGPHEAMVIYPIGDSPEMRGLIEHAERRLGPRVIVLGSRLRREPESLVKLDEPIRRFLDDPELEGREAFWEAVPGPMRGEIQAEIRRACQRRGYGWKPTALKVIVGNRLYAAEIDRACRERELRIDPQRVEALAFGEGFEQCAMTWKSMVADYLGWKTPIENDFALSVTGAAVLFDARGCERIALPNDVRLFLWEKSHGLPVGFFARARCRLDEPQYVVRLPLAAVRWEVWTFGHRLLWPGPEPTLRREGDRLLVPVLNAIRRDEYDIPSYIVAADRSLAELRDLLVHASVQTE